MSATTCISSSASSSSPLHGAVPGQPPPAMIAAELEKLQLGGGMGETNGAKEEMITSTVKTSDQEDAGGERHRPFNKPRAVVQILTCERKPLADGFAHRKSIGRPELESLDPFLSLFEFEFSPPAGFRDHPHRGFENVTYMLEGSFSYHDSSGHKGTINTGGVQWMTAGRGVVHAEMPGGEGVQRGINLVINLSAKDKMVEPRYQELASQDIPTAEKDGVYVKVIAGEALRARSPLQTTTPAMCLDVTMRPGALLRQPIPPGWSACSYVIDGEASFGNTSAFAGAHTCVVFGDGDGVAVRCEQQSARFLLVAARPHREAVVMEIPFVMNTREEVEQAREDYQNCRNGFEMAAGWTSDYAATAAVHWY